MDYIQINDLKMCYKSLGYAIVEQAFQDYKKALLFIKIYKNNSYISSMNIDNETLKSFVRKNQIKPKTRKELLKLYQKNKKLKLKQKLDEIKEINKFVMSDWYDMICPIIDKRIAKDKLESMEREILGDEVYLLN